MSGFGATQFFRNLPLLLVKNVPARLFAPIAARFAVVYVLMIANSFRRGSGVAAMRGAVRGTGLVIWRGLGKRRAMQRARRVPVDAAPRTSLARAPSRDARPAGHPQPPRTTRRSGAEMTGVGGCLPVANF